MVRCYNEMATRIGNLKAERVRQKRRFRGTCLACLESMGIQWRHYLLEDLMVTIYD